VDEVPWGQRYNKMGIREGVLDQYDGNISLPNSLSFLHRVFRWETGKFFKKVSRSSVL